MHAMELSTSTGGVPASSFVDTRRHFEFFWRALGGVLLVATGSLRLADACITKCGQSTSCILACDASSELSDALPVAEASLTAFLVLDFIAKFRKNYREWTSPFTAADSLTSVWNRISIDIVYDILAVVAWDAVARYLEPEPPIPVPLSRRAKLTEAVFRNLHVQRFGASFHRMASWSRGVDVGEDLTTLTSPAGRTAGQAKWCVGLAIKATGRNASTITTAVVPLIKKAKFLNLISSAINAAAVLLWNALKLTKLRSGRRTCNILVDEDCQVPTPLVVQPVQELALPTHLHCRAEFVSFRSVPRKTRRRERRHMRFMQVPTSLSNASFRPEANLDRKITLSASSRASKLMHTFRPDFRQKCRSDRHHVRTVRLQRRPTENSAPLICKDGEASITTTSAEPVPVIAQTVSESASASLPEEVATHQPQLEPEIRRATKLPVGNATFARRPSRDNALAERWQRQVEASLESATAKVVSEKERRGSLVSQNTPIGETNSSNSKISAVRIPDETVNTMPSSGIMATPSPKARASKVASCQRQVSGAKTDNSTRLVATSQDLNTSKAAGANMVAAPSTPKANESKLASFLQAVPSPQAKAPNQSAPANNLPNSQAVTTLRLDALPDQQSALEHKGTLPLQDEKSHVDTDENVGLTPPSETAAAAPSTPKAGNSKLASFLEAVPSPVAKVSSDSFHSSKEKRVPAAVTRPDTLPSQLKSLEQEDTPSLHVEEKRDKDDNVIDVDVTLSSAMAGAAGATSTAIAAPSTPKAGDSKLASFLQAVPSPQAKAPIRSTSASSSIQSPKKGVAAVTWPETLPSPQSAPVQRNAPSHQDDKLPPLHAPEKSKLSAFLQEIPVKSTPAPHCSQPASSEISASLEPEEATTKVVLSCPHGASSRITFTPPKSKAAPRRMKRWFITIRPGVKSGQPGTENALLITSTSAEAKQDVSTLESNCAKNVSDKEVIHDEQERWGALFDSAMDSSFLSSSDPTASPSLGQSEFVALVREFIVKDSDSQLLPDEDDLARAFVLADADNSGAVDKSEFLMLMKLIKQGKVAGLAGSFFNFANWGKEEAFTSALAAWAAPAVASAEELESWRQQFKAYTAEAGTSELGKSDFATLTIEALKRHSIDAVPSESDLEAAFVIADTNASGFLDREEFIKLMILAKKGDIAGLGSLAMMIWNPLTWGKESSFKKSLELL